MDPAAYKTAPVGVPPFFADKFAREAARNWDKFYKRNQARFFRDRHWTTKSETDGFPSLLEQRADDEDIVVVEAGCGAANCAFPLLSENKKLQIFMFDFAQSAISLVKQSPEFNATRCHAFLWDFSRNPFSSVSDPGTLSAASADFVLLVFVLSAVPPKLQQAAVREMYGLLKPGGRVLFRDYATGDMAHGRFATQSRIDDNYFVRQDSTLAYFFDEARLDFLMSAAGFTKVYCRRVDRLIKNRKEGLEMKRVFLQGEYRKDVSC